MSIPADPIEGYYAQQSAPTASALLGAIDRSRTSEAADELAARVEAVLALCEDVSEPLTHPRVVVFARLIRRILDGGKP